MSAIHPDLEADHPDAPDLAAADSGSLLDAFRATRQHLAQKAARETRKQVPLWDGALRIVYRYPEAGSDPIIKAVERASTRGTPEDVLNANCDVLIACCHDIEFCPPDGDFAPLDANAQTRVTRKLADRLELDVPSDVKSPARLILRHLFSPRAADAHEFEGDVSLLTQGGQIVQWLQGQDDQADEALRGE